MSWDVQGYLEKMAPTYGGTCWVVLSTQAAAKTLRKPLPSSARSTACATRASQKHRPCRRSRFAARTPSCSSGDAARGRQAQLTAEPAGGLGAAGCTLLPVRQQSAPFPQPGGVRPGPSSLPCRPCRGRQEARRGGRQGRGPAREGEGRRGRQDPPEGGGAGLARPGGAARARLAPGAARAAGRRARRLRPGGRAQRSRGAARARARARDALGLRAALGPGRRRAHARQAVRRRQGRRRRAGRAGAERRHGSGIPRRARPPTRPCRPRPRPRRRSSHAETRCSPRGSPRTPKRPTSAPWSSRRSWAPAGTGLAFALAAQGKGARAIEAARAATQADARSGEAHAALGLGALAQDPQDKGNEAVSAAQQASFLEPKNPLVKLMLGRVFESRGQLDQANAAYTEAAGLDTTWPAPRVAMLGLQFRTGDVDGALAGVRALPPELKRSGEAQLLLGRLLLKKEDAPDAAKAALDARGRRAAGDRRRPGRARHRVLQRRRAEAGRRRLRPCRRPRARQPRLPVELRPVPRLRRPPRPGPGRAAQGHRAARREGPRPVRQPRLDLPPLRSAARDARPWPRTRRR